MILLKTLLLQTQMSLLLKCYISLKSNFFICHLQLHLSSRKFQNFTLLFLLLFHPYSFKFCMTQQYFSTYSIYLSLYKIYFQAIKRQYSAKITFLISTFWLRGLKAEYQENIFNILLERIFYKIGLIYHFDMYFK